MPVTPLEFLPPGLLLPAWFDPESLISAMGNWALWGVALIIVLECGLFPILPGDTLLFTVGMLIGVGAIAYGAPLATLLLALPLLTAAAVLGNVSGYWLGRLVGPPLFRPRPGLAGRLFDPAYVGKTHEYFERHGLPALIVARFIPFVRTFVTVVAGVARMDFRLFILFTGIGGAIWVTVSMLLGYFLGQVPWVKENLDLTLALIVVVSLIPVGLEFLRRRLRRRTAD